MQVGDTLRDTWRSTMDWSKQQYQSFQQSISTLGSNLYNVGSSAWNETKVWGSALGTGMNYGANIIIPPNTTLYKGLDLISNTLTQPGYNYGMWMYGDKTFGSFLGASLDAGWAVTGVSGAIKAVAGAGAPYWQYYPSSNPSYQSQWLTRGWQPPYKTGTEAYNALRLDLAKSPNPGTAVRQVNVNWWEAIAGGRRVRGGIGWEYFRDSFIFPKD